MSKVAKKIGFMLPGGYILGIKKRNKYFGSLKESFVTQVCGVTELGIHLYYESNIHRTLTFVPMIQKMLPVRCNRKSSIKRLLRYQEKKWRSEIVFFECLFINI